MSETSVHTPLAEQMYTAMSGLTVAADLRELSGVVDYPEVTPDDGLVVSWDVYEDGGPRGYDATTLVLDLQAATAEDRWDLATYRATRFEQGYRAHRIMPGAQRSLVGGLYVPVGHNHTVRPQDVSFVRQLTDHCDGVDWGVQTPPDILENAVRTRDLLRQRPNIMGRVLSSLGSARR